MPTGADSPAIEVVELRKQFPGVMALDRVSMQIRSGEIEAVVGENGAGKSTLMRVLAGLTSPDSGEVRILGRAVRRFDPHAALREHGIALVPQELVLCPDRTVSQNILMGIEPGGRLVPSNKLIEAAARDILAQLGSNISPEARCGSLGVVERQVVVIARALVRHGQILVLDEPTTLLTSTESEALFDRLRSLRDRGATIVYVSHRIAEVFALASRIHVLRDGKVVYSSLTADTRPERVVSEMIGASITSEPKRPSEAIAREVLLQTERLTGPGFRDVSIELRRGEVMGIYGQPDAGRSELLRALFGAPAANRGSIAVSGHEVRIKSAAAAIKLGFGYVPSERRLHGIVALMTVAENLMMLQVPRVSRFGFVRWARLYKEADNLRRAFTIKCSSLRQAVQQLSGGNQQKVVLARWMSMQPKVLLLDEPTRGIDVGAKREIFELLQGIARRGSAVLISSSEIEELLRECDRVAVMHRGRLVRVAAAADLTEERVIRLSLGVEEEVA